jgi:TonB family protein
VKTSRVWTLMRAGVIGGSLLCCASSVEVCAQQETADVSLERVTKAIKNNEWDRAQSGIRRVLGLKPETAEANLIASQVYWQEGARSMAITSLAKAIESQPIFPAAHFLLAQCLKESDKLDNARDEVLVAISQAAPPFPSYRLLAEIDIAKGDFTAAITSIETALRFSQEADIADTAKRQERIQEIEEARAFVEKLERFAVLKAGQSAPDIIRPLHLNSPQPRYPQEARALKLQGRVSMAILVTENGDVDSVLVLRGLGHGLDEEATEVARNLEFAPVMRRGKTIPYWMKLIVEFNLR